MLFSVFCFGLSVFCTPTRYVIIKIKKLIFNVIFKDVCLNANLF